ncbi:MAG: sulfite exporter TauE/SafE family protein, partial [Candidatus Bathyarchaeia archaeon]
GNWSPRSNDRLAKLLALNGRYFDGAVGEEVEYGMDRTPLTFGVSYLAGILSGLLGIGGGGVKVPAMNALSGVPMKAAVGTSNFMIGVTAAASALFYIRNSYCDAFVTAPVILGTLLGASVGARLTKRVRGDTLKLVFVAVLIVMAVRMITSGLGA